MITLGHYLPLSIRDEELRLLCHAKELQRHLDRPWFRAYLAHQLGASFTDTAEQQKEKKERAAVSEAALARHTFVCGATGSGKSRLIEHLLVEQLRQGCSAVVLDPKPDMIAHLLAHAQAIGLTPEQVTLLTPRLSEGIPGWNPFLADIPLQQAAGDFVAVLERSTTSWGPRMQDVLTNALLIIGSHGLSLHELARFLVREEYREALLRLSSPASEQMAYQEARAYFHDEFGAWSKSERLQAVSPVLNKIRELLRSAFLRPLLCAGRNTLHLAPLWQRQGLVLVHLDRVALGEEGTKLLGGLLANLLFRTALRASGPVPVVLSLDELATVEHFLGGAITDIVTVARSQRLRLLVACQHLAQMSEGLRAALLANPAVQVFFRLGHTDARLVAASLAAGAEPRVRKVVAGVEWENKSWGQAAMTEWRHPIREATGHPVRLDEAGWERLKKRPDYWNDPARTLRSLAGEWGARRLYVLSADRKEPVEVVQYVAGLSHSDYQITGPAPLELVVSFPRPRLSGIERWSEREALREWTKALQELPVQQAVLRLSEPEGKGGQQTGLVKIVNVPNPPNDPEQKAFRRAVLRANGQSVEEMEATARWRGAGGAAGNGAQSDRKGAGRRWQPGVRQPAAAAAAATTASRPSGDDDIQDSLAAG